MPLDPVVARKTWRTLEPVHGLIYFAPEADEHYEAIGLEGNRMGYFASRSAAMGVVPAEVVIATFFNFNPALVRRVIPRAWELASPERVIAARFEAADAMLRRVWSDDELRSPELAEVAVLARRAAEVACEHLEGRPLFAAHARLPWPDDAHLVAWHAQTLLREFRGDAHVAALLLDGLSGIGALVMHAATGDVAERVLQQTRAWPDADWQLAVDDLTQRGLVARSVEGVLEMTAEGRRRRDAVEDRTDAASVVAYEAIGEEGCDRLRALARPFSKAVVASGFGPGAR